MLHPDGHSQRVAYGLCRVLLVRTQAPGGAYGSGSLQALEPRHCQGCCRILSVAPIGWGRSWLDWAGRGSVGFGWIGLGWTGSGLVGLLRTGSGWVGLGCVGLGRVGLGSVET